MFGCKAELKELLGRRGCRILKVQHTLSGKLSVKTCMDCMDAHVL